MRGSHPQAIRFSTPVFPRFCTLVWCKPGAEASLGSAQRRLGCFQSLVATDGIAESTPEHGNTATRRRWFGRGQKGASATDLSASLSGHDLMGAGCAALPKKPATGPPNHECGVFGCRIASRISSYTCHSGHTNHVRWEVWTLRGRKICDTVGQKRQCMNRLKR